MTRIMLQIPKKFSFSAPFSAPKHLMFEASNFS